MLMILFKTRPYLELEHMRVWSRSALGSSWLTQALDAPRIKHCFSPEAIIPSSGYIDPFEHLSVRSSHKLLTLSSEFHHPGVFVTPAHHRPIEVYNAVFIDWELCTFWDEGAQKQRSPNLSCRGASEQCSVWDRPLSATTALESSGPPPSPPQRL